MGYSYKQYCSVGEFAKLCRVNKQTLQFYDKEGIFSPELVDEKGYRYYAFHQLDIFRILTALKSINTPLKTIKEYLNHRSKNDLLALLVQQQAKIQEEIERLTLANQIIENKLSQVQYANSADFGAIEVRYQEEAYLVLSEELHELDEKTFNKTIADHIAFCDEHHLNVGYPIGSIISYDNLCRRQFDFTYWFTKTDYYQGKYAHLKPAGWYIIGYYSGYYGTNTAIYDQMLDFAGANHWQLCGHAYENSVIDMFMANDRNHYMTEVAIAVKPLESIKTPAF